uniref:SEFIR domain-containing protein n=1 Tax=Branchiostoma floridae TaxID=7739 RepID=C3YAT5_BRAFL|eukprot:XP_002606526.1 hypothetical protein BRAFLDRAFT_102558 [Branchiostoma floridae]
MAARYFALPLLTAVLAVAVLRAEASTACNRRCSKQVDVLTCLRRCKRGTVQHRARHGRTGPVKFDYPLREISECSSHVPIKAASITPVPDLKVALTDASSDELDRVRITWRAPETGYELVTGFEVDIVTVGRTRRSSYSCRQLLLNRTLQAKDVLSKNYFEYITDLSRGLKYRVIVKTLPGQHLEDNSQTSLVYEATWKPEPVEIVRIVGRNVTVSISLAPGDFKIDEYNLQWSCDTRWGVDKFNTTGATATWNRTLYHLPPGQCGIQVSSTLDPNDPIWSNTTTFSITDWTPDNLTANCDGTEVSVTFRGAPSECNFQDYRICLSVNTSNSHSENMTCNPLFKKDDDTGVVKAEFEHVKPLLDGHFYAVKVGAPYQDCEWTQVRVTTAMSGLSESAETSVPPKQRGVHITHIVAVVSVAVLIGLALLGILYYLRKNKPQRPIPRLFLVYSYDCPEHFTVVERFAASLQRMGFNVVLDMWCTNQISCVGKVEWACEQLDRAEYVIVLCSLGGRHKMEDRNEPPLQEGLLGDMFTPWVKEIGSRIHSGDSGSLRKYVVAYFSYSSAEDVPRTLRGVQPQYQLMKHLPELFCHLQRMERRSAAGTARVEGLEDIQRETVEAIEAMQKLCDDKPDWLFNTNDDVPHVVDVSTPSTPQEEIPLLPTPSENSVDMSDSTTSISDAQDDENAQDQQPLLRNGAAKVTDVRLSPQDDDCRVDVSPSGDVLAVTGNIGPIESLSGTLETAQKRREDDPDRGIPTSSEPSVKEAASGSSQAPPPPQTTTAFPRQVLPPAPQEQYIEYGPAATGGPFGDNPRDLYRTHTELTPPSPPQTTTTTFPPQVPIPAEQYLEYGARAPSGVFAHNPHTHPNGAHYSINMYENPMYLSSPSYHQHPYIDGQGTGHLDQPGGYPGYREENRGSDEQPDSGIFMEDQLRLYNQMVWDSMLPQ